MALPPLPLRPSRPGMSRRTRARLSFVLGVCIVAIVVVAVVVALFPGRGETLLPVGAAAPGFTLHSTAGAVVSLPSLRGKTVLLVFCASWSSHCVAEVPVLNRLRTITPAIVLYVDGDSEDAESVSSFGRSFHARFPLVLDPGATTVTFPAHGPRGPVTALYRVTEFPTLYVVGPGGRIAWRAVGEPPASLLARELRRAARPVP
jgi:peroxiredoxin